MEVMVTQLQQQQQRRRNQPFGCFVWMKLAGVCKHVNKYLISLYLFCGLFKTNALNSMSVFTMKVNPLIGKKEWVAKPEHYDYYQEVARSSYADMLHDKERNEKYHTAIKKAIQSMKEQGRSAKVLDIGTGTGLLSMMAAQCGADSIVACEVFRPVAKCAEEVIKENGFEDKIKIVLKHSTELEVGPDGDLKERANILVAEVFDTELIGEGALKTFKHAIDNLLEPDSIVIPSSASVYIQIVDSPVISAWNKLFPIQVESDKTISPPKSVTSCPGLAAVHDIQLSQIKKNQFTAITDPICVFQFDFTGKKSIEMNETFIKQVTAITNGNCEVVFMWWTLKMDMDGDVILNNGPSWVQPNPNKVQWRDHWMQAVYYLPKSVKVSENDRMTLIAFHDEYSLWFTIPKDSEADSPTCNCLAHVSDSRLRIGMKNDQHRNSKYIDMLKKVITPSSICLCVSDGSLLPLMAAKLGAKRVFTVESSNFHQSMLKSYIEANNEADVIKVINKDPIDLTEADLEHEKVDVLIAEPYFTNCVRPWELMCFWHLRHVLSSFVKSSTKVIPEYGTLKAMGVNFDDLWKIRAPVISAEGFNLSKFDEMVQKAISLADSTVEPHPLWEYPCKPVTEAFDLLKIDFSKNVYRNSIDILGEQPIISDSICNGVVLWTDYCFDGIEVTTGPIDCLKSEECVKWYMNTQQGVYFIHPPTEVKKDGNTLSYNVSFNLETADTSLIFTIQEK